MRLSQIINSYNPLIDGIVNLYCSILCEGAKGPWWPEEWAVKTLKDPKFETWLKTIGIEGKIGTPMAGRVGRAFPVGDKHILKFTTDSKEANAAAVLKGHDSSHAANVYDVKRVMTVDDPGGTGRRVSLFAIAMERLNTGVGKRMRAAGNAVYNYLDDNPGFIEDPGAVVRVVMSRYLSPKLQNDTAMVGVVQKVVMALYDVQKKTGVLSQDPHGGNIALKGRNTAFFDFGRSSTDFDHPKSADARVTSLI